MKINSPIDTSREKKKQKLVETAKEYSPLALLMGLLGNSEFTQSSTQLHKLMQLLSTVVTISNEPEKPEQAQEVII